MARRCAAHHQVAVDRTRETAAQRRPSLRPSEHRYRGYAPLTPPPPFGRVRDAGCVAHCDLFDTTYADIGRESIAPEKLMRALLLQVLCSVRSERMLCEQMKHNLPFRWFEGIPIDQETWNHSVFSKNRDRLQVIESFFTEEPT